MGHEFIGVVEEVGAEVRTVKPGDLVVVPFAWSDGTCEFCRQGLQTSCLHGGWWGGDLDGGQGEAVRVPQADGTLVVLPVGARRRADAVAPHPVGRHGHRPPRGDPAEVGPGKAVAVVGDGAVGLCGVIAATPARRRADHPAGPSSRPDRVGREFGATDIVSERGEAAIQRVRDLTGGLGAHSVLECVGLEQARVTALSVARDGGCGRTGRRPQDRAIPAGVETFFKNITIAGGPAPARAYIPELLPDVLAGRIHPGRVFDRITDLDGVPDGYRAMDEREAIKVLIQF